MKGVLALYGSGEFTEAMVPVDQFLLSRIKSPKIAIFPTAAGQEHDFRKWITGGEKHYRKLGAVAKGFEIIDKKTANSKVVAKEIADFNFFVFSGGDPGYLLETLSESSVWKVVEEKYSRGSYVVGSSAGAMVLGKKVWDSIYKFDKEGILTPWKAGFGLVDFGILPHFNEMGPYLGKEKMGKALKNLPIDTEVVGIDEDTAYIKLGEVWKTFGKGKIHKPVKTVI